MSRVHEQRERLAAIKAGNYLDARCGHCSCDASPQNLQRCAEEMLAFAQQLGEPQAETVATLEYFKKELAAMSDVERGAFMLARDEILRVVQRYPGVGLMAVAYVGTEEAAKIPDPQLS